MRRVELRFLCLSDAVAYRCSPPDIQNISGVTTGTKKNISQFFLVGSLGVEPSTSGL